MSRRDWLEAILVVMVAALAGWYVAQFILALEISTLFKTILLIMWNLSVFCICFAYGKYMDRRDA